MNILGIIPAREGSKRVPQKNFRPFVGTTLTDLAIQQALDSSLLTHIALSSDAEEVLEIGRKYPKIFCLKRPEAISSDDAPAIEYVWHTLADLEPKLGLKFDLVVILQPSSPLRNTEDIDATIQLLLDNPDSESAVSVMKVNQLVHPLKFKTLEGKVLKPYLEEEAGRFAAKDLPEIFVRNGAAYSFWRADLENKSDVIGKNCLAYLMPSARSVDINEWVDFEFAAYLFEKQRGTQLLPSVNP